MMSPTIRKAMGFALAGLLCMAPIGIAATVEGVDQSKGTLKLHAADGDRLEFKAPKGMLASLHEGDRVQIAIQKAPGTPEGSVAKLFFRGFWRL